MKLGMAHSRLQDLIALRLRSGHDGMTHLTPTKAPFRLEAQHHRATSAVRSIHDSVVPIINPLAINAHPVATIFILPIGVINAASIAGQK
jgi:hypothetical protein